MLLLVGCGEDSQPLPNIDATVKARVEVAKASCDCTYCQTYPRTIFADTLHRDGKEYEFTNGSMQACIRLGGYG